jgi:4-amino-4-deoxy-L-arabinose transferase-like glycosyltransferase
MIFLASQTIILSAHDVRTDAVLTGFIALSIWQFLAFIKTQKISNVILAGFFTALAFSSKGLMAIVIIGFSVFSYLLYSREWLKFFNVKIIFAALSFGVGILPILYAYYHQFGNEGVEFIFFNQSVNRLQAKGFEQNSPDYSFFFTHYFGHFYLFQSHFTRVFSKELEI